MDHGEPAHDAVAQALLELEQSHERFPSLFARTRDFVVLLRLDGRVVTSNPATLEVVGFRPEELAGVHFRELVLAKHLEIIAHAFGRAARGETETFELTLLHKTGHAIDFSATLVPAIAHGLIVGVYAIGKDVSGLKVVEHRFDREIQALASLIQHHPDSVVALDREGRITRTNAQMEALIGYREDEMVGRSFAQFIAPDALASTVAIFESTIAGDTSRDVASIVHKSGRRIDVLGIAVPITVDGDIVGMYSIGHDVTEQRRLEASVAEQADRLRDLYVVAATTGRDPDAQIDAALELGARRLNCEGAYLARVHGRMVEAVRSLGYGERPPGLRPLAESLLRFPMQRATSSPSTT